MQQIINFFLRSRDALLFLFLFGLALVLTIDSHGYHKTLWVSSNNVVFGNLHEWQSSLGDYFSLDERNASLQAENQYLRQQLLNRDGDGGVPLDSMSWTPDYKITPGMIVRNTHKKTHNYAIINRGSRDSIAIDQGVIGPSGIVGLIDEVGPRYSRIITLLNPDVSWEAQLKGTNLFGILSWDQRNHRVMDLEDIPRLARVRQGDTVVTGQYSRIFPQGIPIGVVSQVNLQEGKDYYDLKVQLLNDLARSREVYVVEQRDRIAVDTLLNLPTE